VPHEIYCGLGSDIGGIAFGAGQLTWSEDAVSPSSLLLILPDRAKVYGVVRSQFLCADYNC
jgi:hypothetical protein